jgi:hypothetical protein
VKVRAEAGLPKLTGHYIFGEVCSGRLASLDTSGTKLVPRDLGERTPYLTFIGEGPGGNVYVTSLNGGVYRVTSV